MGLDDEKELSGEAREAIVEEHHRKRMANLAASLGYATDVSLELLGFLLDQQELIGSLQARLAAQERDNKKRESLWLAAERMGCPGNLKLAAHLESPEERIAENATECHRRIDEASEHINWSTPSNLI